MNSLLSFFCHCILLPPCRFHSTEILCPIVKCCLNFFVMGRKFSPAFYFLFLCYSQCSHNYLILVVYQILLGHRCTVLRKYCDIYQVSIVALQQLNFSILYSEVNFLIFSIPHSLFESHLKIIS